MKCEHVGERLHGKVDEDGGRFGEIADEFFNDVIIDDIFDDDLNNFLI